MQSYDDPFSSSCKYGWRQQQQRHQQHTNQYEWDLKHLKPQNQLQCQQKENIPNNEDSFIQYIKTRKNDYGNVYY